MTVPEPVLPPPLPPARPGSRPGHGRTLLIVLVMIVAVFIDFETMSLLPYQQDQKEQYFQSYDSLHVMEGEQQRLERINAQRLIALLKANATFLHDGLVQIDQQEETTTTIKTKTCTPFSNSQKWKQGPRFQNADDPIMTTDQWYNYINTTNMLNRIDDFTSATICNVNGTFRSPNTNNKKWDLQDEDLLTEWQIRLTYLAIHYHMHNPAMTELNARKEACHDETTFPKMDFECKDTKFLIANVATTGLGASFRLGIVTSLWMGLATNRVTVFVNLATTGPSFLQLPWPLASCSRHDMQCFFMPSTPCALTMADIEGATVLPEEDARDLRRSAIISPTYDDQRVLAVATRLNPPMGKYKIQLRVREALYKHAMTIIDNSVITDKDKVLFLQKAALRILKLDSFDGVTKDVVPEYNASDYRYSMKDAHFPHLFLMYAMRPKFKYQALSNQLVTSALPPSVNLDQAIGLPIRGSDKCYKESICLKHELYMDLIEWTQDNVFHNSTEKAKVILTTEDATILNKSIAYSDRFQFLTNTQDVLQGTGAPVHYKDQADQVMLTTIVAMKMQLHGRVLYGNCCSNFYIMLMDLLKEGCGAHKNSIFSCMQEHSDRKYNICCSWTKTDECNVTREAQKIQ